MNLTIPRTQWCYGSTSKLVNADGTACILGHLLLALGYAPEELKRFSNVAAFADETGRHDEVLAHPILSKLVKLGSKRTPYLVRSDLAQLIVDANDDIAENAERLLVPLLARIGVELRFVG